MSEETKMKLLYQGAEARVFEVPFQFDSIVQKAVCKERFSKKYRHPVLDQKLTTRRVLQEARSLFRCKKSGINAPTLYLVDPENSTLYMEFIPGCTLKNILSSKNGYEECKVDFITKDLHLADKMGHVISDLHNIDLIHGDLTTSNLMFDERNSELVLLDFGLSYSSTVPEDKAVDLYVLERAFLSTHPNSQSFFERALDAYSMNSKDSKNVMKKLEEGSFVN